jgi:hypothetical protein
MSTPEREWKHIQRRLRSIPVEEIGPRILAGERDGLWCLVARELQFVPANGSTCEVAVQTLTFPLRFSVNFAHYRDGD